VGLPVADSVRGIRPSVTTAIAINGGQPTAPVGTLGDSVGDVLNLDLSGLPAASSFVLATLAGVINSPGLQPLSYGQIEDLNFITNNQLLNLQMGDTLVRGSSGPDSIIFSKNPTPADPTGTRVRLNAIFVDFPMSGKTLTYAGDANDYITHANVTFPMESHGEGGDDYIAGGMGNDYLIGGQGNDQINASGGDNIVVGDDELSPAGAPTQDSAVGGNDVLSALSGNDVFYGGGGSDQVSPGAGNDYLYGGEGDDILDGNLGDDRVYGGGGNDVLAGSSGNDLLSGGAGNDLLMGADGNDVLIGGTGADSLDGGSGDDLIITGSVANENSSWTSTASTTTFGAGIYSRPTDNDAALLLLLTQWSLSGDRSSLTAITNDATLDLAWGYTGNDDFNAAANEAQDFNASGMGTDETF
jgi:fibronectin-binding autotransporter adhesin